MRVLVNLAALLIILMMIKWSEPHGVPKPRENEENLLKNPETNRASDNENEETCRDYLPDVSDSRKFRRCWKHSGKYPKQSKSRGVFDGFIIPSAESQFLEKLVLQGRAAEDKGGEIYEPKRKNNTSILGKIKKFLRKFRFRGSKTSPRPEETSVPDDDLRGSRTESAESDTEGTTPGELPVEVILPVSGVFANASTTKVPDFGGLEDDHTVYEAGSEENRGKQLEYPGTRDQTIHETTSEGSQSNNLKFSGTEGYPIHETSRKGNYGKHWEPPSGPPQSGLFGARHATFDLEIKAIPILNRQRILLHRIN